MQQSRPQMHLSIQIEKSQKLKVTFTGSYLNRISIMFLFMYQSKRRRGFLHSPCNLLLEMLHLYCVHFITEETSPLKIVHYCRVNQPNTLHAFKLYIN